MPNRTYALEWLNLAKRNLDTARLLIRENHYTDSIAIIKNSLSS
jgi:HEPN domain-containing protein